MHQIWHIFRKDCRRFWPEILVSLAITAAFVWTYPYQWSSSRRVSGLLDLHHLQILAETATTLVPVSWAFLITRVVHAENLAGNRQFWITRPYEWKKLLSAKLLFFAAFVYIPFAVAQLLLLARAGFSPMHYLGDCSSISL